MEKDIMLCSCNSVEHQYIFIKDTEDKMIFVQVHLVKERNIFKRILKAIKYIFGYKCMYGNFDEFVIDENNYKEFKNIINFFENS